MTNKNQLIEKLHYNWYLKLLCLLAAILIYIFYKSSLVESKNFVVPLNIIENGSVVCVDGLSDNIKIVIKADSDHIALIRASDINASIDITNVTKTGLISVPVKLSVPDEYYTFDPFEIRAEPENLKINIEKKITASKKVKPLIAGEPSYGFEVAEITVVPEFVEVAGTESLINATDFINTTAINVTDKSSKFTVDANIVEVNKQISILNKGPFKVTVDFAVQTMEKAIDNLKIYVTGLWPDLKITSVLPPVTAKVEGSVSLLEKYNPGRNSIVVDLSGITEPGTYDLPVKSYFPDAFAVKSISPETISVTISQIKENPAINNKETEKIEEKTIEESTEDTIESDSVVMESQ